MSFSPEWEQRFAENAQMSVWPWSDLVSLVRRHCKQLGPESRVLELGCGAGANIPFFQSLGVQYRAIEGSSSVVKRLHTHFAELAERIAVGDFTAEQPFGEGFDLIVDRASVTHNTTEAIIRTLRLVRRSLKPEGLFIGVDWFSTEHSDFSKGQPAEDSRTRRDFTSGPFAGLGRVHFSDESHLRKLFSDFELLFLEHKRLDRVEPTNAGTLGFWHVVARKPYS
jgi:SAM-dependent methyltransferase